MKTFFSQFCVPVPFSRYQSEGLLLKNIAQCGGASIATRQQTGTRVFQKQTRAGFTLIETLIAVSVLMIAIVGPLTLAQNGISSAVYARDQITASYLAQEAIEFVRNVRDQNNLGQVPGGWLSGLDKCVGSTCGVDPNAAGNLQVISCTISNQNCLLYFNPSLGVYTHDSTLSAVASNFSRQVVITTPIGGSANEALVSVTISWQSGKIARSFTLNEHILNWLK